MQTVIETGKAVMVILGAVIGWIVVLYFISIQIKKMLRDLLIAIHRKRRLKAERIIVPLQDYQDLLGLVVNASAMPQSQQAKDRYIKIAQAIIDKNTSHLQLHQNKYSAQLLDK